ncbi:hypothetical protein [Hymenobacter sp. CRA2]|uniref:DUF7674 family protein n=1 Tax=Hymenobacter sp. CRA2 TaxID=1955620 RepID=UPI00098F4DDB|nr:hypothetical protein [Hymenobacter sp. CRA2]OON70903.1 hypothetical protein B0919_02555 [Hymenobacter sp. CRA2]
MFALHTCDDVLREVRQSLPELATELDAAAAENRCRLHHFFEFFAGYTCRFLGPDRASSLRLLDCFALANRLYTLGSASLRCAIEVTYLYDLHLDRNSELMQRARQLLPPSLLACQRRMQCSMLP